MSDIEKGESVTRSTSHTGHQTTTAGYTHRKFGNPGPLGLFSFASTTFILSLFNLQTRGITHPNSVVGMALFTGGLVQLLAGMWEFAVGNTFGGTAFSSYGAFWMSFATILIPGSGIVAGYANPAEFEASLGIFLIAWFMVTFFFFVVSLRKSIGFMALFGCLTITYLMLALGKFYLNHIDVLTQAGGGFGVITAFVAYYVGLSELLASETRPIVRFPLGLIKHD